MRTTSSVKNFPYGLETMAYVLIDFRDDTFMVRDSKTSLEDIAEFHLNRGGTLLAAWPGQSRTDVFFVDDREAFLSAVSPSLRTPEDDAEVAQEPLAEPKNQFGCEIGVCIDPNTGYHNFNLHR